MTLYLLNKWRVFVADSWKTNKIYWPLFLSRISIYKCHIIIQSCKMAECVSLGTGRTSEKRNVCPLWDWIEQWKKNLCSLRLDGPMKKECMPHPPSDWTEQWKMNVCLLGMDRAMEKEFVSLRTAQNKNVWQGFCLVDSLGKTVCFKMFFLFGCYYLQVKCYFACLESTSPYKTYFLVCAFLLFRLGKLNLQKQKV